MRSASRIKHPSRTRRSSSVTSTGAASISARSWSRRTAARDTPDGPVTITDRGQFASGVSIQHVLGTAAYVDGDTTCGLSSVRFDDGTVWLRTGVLR
jgi:hypothetical protein